MKTINISLKSIISLISFCFVCVICANAQGLPYKSGESLTYVLNYKWGAVNTDVGEGVVNIKLEDGIYHSIVSGQTYKFYDIFFKVREHFESKFRESDGRPIYFHRKTSEGKYRMINTYHFNNDYSISAKTKKNDHPVKDTLLKANSNTYDLVSLFYKIRTLNFSKIPIGVPQPISFAIDREIYNMSYVYYGEFVKKIPKLGTFKVLKFSVRLVAGEVFTGKDDMIVWVTADENKVPLQFESPIIVGKVYGRLIKFSNLKYPLSSKVK